MQYRELNNNNNNLRVSTWFVSETYFLGGKIQYSLSIVLINYEFIAAG